jgi:hypothetical protein
MTFNIFMFTRLIAGAALTVGFATVAGGSGCRGW